MADYFSLRCEGVDLRGVGARFAVFLLGVLVYAGFGAPTPEVVGWPEIAVFLCLVFALWRPVLGLCSERPVLALCFAVGGFVPAVVGVMNGHGGGLILRDVAAFLFLMVPFLGMRFFQGREGADDFARERGANYSDLYSMVFFVLGLSFAGRSVLAGFDFLSSDLDYFSNSPAVMFMVLFGVAGVYRLCLSARFDFGVVVRMCVLLACVCVGVVAMSMSLQRISLAFFVVFVLVLVVRLWLQRPVVGVLVSLVLGGLVMWQFEVFETVYRVLESKTRLYGGNMRIEEAAAVWNEIVSGSVWRVVFGTGWGGVFASPAVADITVNFTHNFFTSFLLKTGVVGFLGAILFVGYFLRRVLFVVRCDFVRGYAVLAPFVITTLFYASYKSFDFGLLLLLIIITYSCSAKQYYRAANS